MALKGWPERMEAVLATLAEMVEAEKIDIGPEIYEQQDSLPSDDWLLEEGKHHELRNRKNGEKLYYDGSKLLERWLETADEHGRPADSLRSNYDDKREYFRLSYERWQYANESSDCQVAKGVRSKWKKAGEEIITQDLKIYWVEPALLVKSYYVSQADRRATSWLRATFTNGRLVEASFSRYKARLADSDPGAIKESEERYPLYFIGAKWGEDQSAEAAIKEEVCGGEISSLTIARDSRDKITYSSRKKTAQQPDRL